MTRTDKRGPVFRAETLLQEAMKIPDGDCRSDTNPDAWFPDFGGRGRVPVSKYKAIAAETKRAIDICNACPAKKECLEAGMDPVNLPYGIWGGTLPPERMLASGKTYARNSEAGITLYGLRGLKVYLNELGLETNWYEN